MYILAELGYILICSENDLVEKIKSSKGNLKMA